MDWLQKMMPTCKEVALRLSYDTLNKVPLFKRLMMRLHLSMCKVCGPFARQLDVLGKAFKTKFGKPVDPDTVKKVKERIKEKLRS